MQKQQHDRFKDAPWYNAANDTTVILGGAGGIGSWTGFLLARAGFKVVVFDYDIVELINIGGQLFKIADQTSLKVEALKANIEDFSGESITVYNERVTSKTFTHKYVITAFDNMKARKAMFDKWCELDDEDALFIDARLNAEQMWIYCVRPTEEDRVKYRNALFDDSEMEEISCTMKQTSHAAAMIASHIVGFLTNHITNMVSGREERAVPFYWEYYIPLNIILDETTTPTTGNRQNI